MIAGIGLHGGKPATVELLPEPGPLRIERDGVARALDDFRLEDADFCTSIACDAFRLRTVEHLFAALAGLGVRDGLRVVVVGEELPLVDGGARAFASRLATLGLAPRGPRLRVAREGVVDVEGSAYAFMPGPRVEVEVEVELPPSCAPRARWAGDAASFALRVAPARTFALERDLPRLAALGLARHVAPEHALVVTDDSIHGSGPVEPDEPARHKLLDLIGDAYFHGGPPLGVLRARRPGHARNHAALRRALEQGILERTHA